MIMAETVVIPIVMGMRIEIVATGPIPGNTPIKVPNETPMKQARSTGGCNVI
jgi:hypothetical protein